MHFKGIAALTAQPMNASANSQPILIDQIYGFAVECVATGGSAAGTVQVQGSLASAGIGLTISTWSNIGTPIAISAAGNQIVNFDAQYYKWARVTFTATSGGAGDALTVRVGIKGP